MRSDKVIAVNRRIEIRVGTAEAVYHSRIEGVTGKVLTVAAPLRQGVPVFVRPGTTITVDIPFQDKRYSFQCPVVEVVPGQLPVWNLEPPKEIKTTNLRAFFRLDVAIDATVSFGSDSAHSGSCVVINLSGNGLLATVPTSIVPENANAATVFFSDLEGDNVEVSGEIVRMEEVDTTGRNTKLALHFTDIPEAVRSKIIRFLFAEQRRLRQRGIL